LARTLLVRANEEQEDANRTKQMAEAERVFQQAVQLAPTDVTTWSSLFAFYMQTDKLESAVETLDQFKQQRDIDPVQKELVLAKLFDIMQRTAEAAQHWCNAARKAADLEDAEAHLSALSQVAEYFAPFSPALAERYSRQALKLNPSAKGSLHLLIRLLAAQSDTTSTAEALQLLEKLPDVPSQARVEKQSLQAKLLAQRNQPGDVEQAIRLLESLPSSKTDDKLLLGQLCGDVDRIATGYELLENLAFSATPRARNLAAYLQFWQQHFQAKGTFLSRSQDVLLRFDQLPVGLPEWLRWKLRLAQTAAQTADDKLTTSESIAAPILDWFWALPDTTRALGDVQSSQSLLVGLFRTLLEEGYLDQAVQICREPPGDISPKFATRLLANTLIAYRLEDTDQVAAGQDLLDQQLQLHPTDLLLLQDAGDLAALQGMTERATEFYQQILTTDADHLAATNNLSALLSDNPQRRQEALQMIEGALAKHPDDARLLDTKGLILLRMDRAQEAIEVLTEAANADPTSVSVYLHIALARTQLGQQDAAEDAAIIALALGANRAVLAPFDRQTLSDLREKYQL
jgi:tetratricopeptide (TPR) repeat protein